MHLWTPPPNGMKESAGRADARSGDQRSGSKVSGAVEDSLLVVQDVGAVGQAGALRQQVFSQDDVAGGEAGEYPARWIQSERFGDRVSDLGETFQVVPGGGASAEDGVDLGADARGGVGMAAQKIQGPGQVGGGGLDSGKENGDDLVVDLPWGEGVAVLVDRGE